LKTTAPDVAPLNEPKQRNNMPEGAREKAEQQLKSHHIKWQQDESSLVQATESLKKTLQEKD